MISRATRPTALVAALILGSLFFLPSCGQMTRPDDRLYGTLWVQSAAEYQGLSRQTWRQVVDAVATTRSDRTVSAVGDAGGATDLRPPAVIVDVDETVLDNAPYQARLIENGDDYASESWAAWVNEARAEPVPGARQALRDIDAMGVSVFYVTNRNADLEDATRRNLTALGFPIKTGRDHVLMRNEHDDGGSDKSPRRATVAATHRIIALVGDDLGDFGPGKKDGRARREQIVADNAARWGHTWFVLPNPMYGSWERSLYDFERVDAKERRARQHAALDLRR